jgi:hypothetical protein
MAAIAEVIDLEEVRRQRRLKRGAQADGPSLLPAPMAWMPVVFFFPVWISAISPELLRVRA